MLAAWLGLVLLSLTTCQLPAAEAVPHAQDKPPGPALSPAEAIARMTVPEGFRVELVASEPDIVNPVAMTFDDRGRIWITESLEYPRHTPGPGRDRVKVLEDTDGDGRADKVTVFAEGLNIPSGIAVGHGGVWVVNSPDLLFLQDTDGDGRADKQEVVLTGFGRADTHELPNSLTWGPDGWLYGLNGVFNPSRIQHQGREHQFTCALFRIDPRTRAFELFAEGTSNPWGIAWNNEGEAILSACVIDHLWHLTETGYYLRQGGPYPPFTWILPSIVKHHHQKAAYCGITWFDSDAYPAEYRERLYMGNIHGGCLNVDRLEREGSTYRGLECPDFLTANDAWFMPVAQKTGPDGCLYVLDWYDRYHCYQDAGRDPQGIDRLKGRLYRVRYQNTPRAEKFDLTKETDAQLIARLASPNIYYRESAQRLLAERNAPDANRQLEQLVLAETAPRKTRLHALWSLVGAAPLEPKFHQQLLRHADATFRAWGVRAAGNRHQNDADVTHQVLALATDPAADVRLQVAIASRKLPNFDALPVLLQVLAASEGDKLIPAIVWQNLHPLVDRQGKQLLTLLAEPPLSDSPAVLALFPRLCERIVGHKHADPALVATLLQRVMARQQADPTTARQLFDLLAKKVQTHEIAGDQLTELRLALEQALRPILSGPADQPIYFDAALLATTLGDDAGSAAVRKVFASAGQPVARRLQALEALVAARDAALRSAVEAALTDRQAYPVDLRGPALGALGRLDDAWVSQVVLQNYATLEPELQPKAVELLTERPEWAHALLDAIALQKIPAAALDANLVRKLLSSRDKALVEKVQTQWGSVRSERDPRREQVIAEIRLVLRRTPGDAAAGQAVFGKVCGQCHKIYGAGSEVGPDLTANGRSSLAQLLSNVFDPSLVIGAGYRTRTVITADGRVLTGLLAEDSPQRVVLKIQGGKLETIPREEVEELRVSNLSLMPEELEKQFKPQELADLFAFLTLDKPPSDPAARQLPGLRALEPQSVSDPARFAEVAGLVAPGFSTPASGEGGLTILAEHLGRADVLRTHPVAREQPCVLSSTVELPAGKKSRLVLAVSHHERGDWRLLVKADGRVLHDSIVGPQSAKNGWADISIDLTPLAGKKVRLELLNQPTEWAWEFGYWGRVEIVSE